MSFTTTYDRSIMKNTMIVITLISAFWVLLTFYVQNFGNEVSLQIGDESTCVRNALIVLNPDPIYDFDKQICMSTASGLNTRNICSKIVSVENAPRDVSKFDVVVFCSNTYNFQPDWKVTKYIKRIELSNIDVVAITLGAGSTETAQKSLEKLLVERNANILSSNSYWLLKPNDETRAKEDNIEIARVMAKQRAKQIFLN